MLQKVTNFLLTLAYPQACHSCGNSVEISAGGIACGACWEKTRVFTGRETLCHKCGAFQGSDASGIQTFCRRCDDNSFDRAAAVGLYEFALSASVLSLKQDPFVARRLRDLLMARFRNSDFQNADLIVPVPLSKKRRFERGFNQAEILAEVLVKQTGIKLDKVSLARRMHTPMHRAGMDRKARAQTVVKAFNVNRKNLIEGKNILLIDDVFTSGATVSSCSKALKSAGARQVYALTIARTL